MPSKSSKLQLQFRNKYQQIDLHGDKGKKLVLVIDILGRIMSDGKLFLSDNLYIVRPLLQNIFLFFGTSHESEIEIFFYNSEKKLNDSE